MNDDIVYVLGAGVNQSIKTIDRKQVVSPPLAKNFFEVALKVHPRFRDYETILRPLYDYISKYWRKTISDLEVTNFDLEECFTLIQLQLTEARLEKDSQRVNDLLKIQYFLVAFFAEVLSEFTDYYILSGAMLGFGKILYSERPMVITFNYDVFIESVTQLSDSNWSRSLAYGIKFDNILPLFREKHFDKRIFYSQKKNKLYPWSILKLHGSLNWWKYVNDTPNPYISQEEIVRLYESKKKQVVLENLVWFLPISETPYNEDQLFVEPIIITPVLHKQFYDEKFIYKKVFDPLWRRAKSSLSKCKTLIIIGYSFPATDFHTRKLFLESLADNIVNELIIVNPDSIAIEETKRLTRFKRIRIFKSLEHFVQFRILEHIVILCFCCLCPV